ncbi:MAG: type II toxin-antitoxin system HicB family antitoxin, partial [Aliarcobacter sp.]|nr:type II toxin-antitoxin system HicB family antitoxin [Aliarcobacter sp.]
MLKNDYIFPALFTYDTDGITVDFLDLPGAITAGDTEDKALLMAKECLELHLYGIKEDRVAATIRVKNSHLTQKVCLLCHFNLIYSLN